MKSLIFILLGVFMLGTSLICNLAHAQGRHTDVQFNSMDTNGDGVISQQEFVDAAAKRAEKAFRNHDTNGDRMLTRDEFSEGPQKRATARQMRERTAPTQK